MFGVGAYWDEDVTADFVTKGYIAIGYDEVNAPVLYDVLRTIQNGDTVYIKSAPHGDLFIKAVGIVTDDRLFRSEQSCPSPNALKVKWLWQGSSHVGRINDKLPVRSCTIYKEYSKEIQRHVLSLI